MSNNDYISREAASKVITELLSSPFATEGAHSSEIEEALSLVRDMIRGNVPKGMQIPGADVRQVVRGEWIDKGVQPYRVSGSSFVRLRYVFECSNCHCEKGIEYIFCPNCGADMRGEKDG